MSVDIVGDSSVTHQSICERSSRPSYGENLLSIVGSDETSCFFPATSVCCNYETFRRVNFNYRCRHWNVFHVAKRKPKLQHDNVAIIWQRAHSSNSKSWAP